MQVLKTAEEVRRWRKKNDGKRIGFVATMGCLHGGHESLIRTCVEENEVSVVSIFVNPGQFAAGEDLESYPRTEEEDKRMCGCAGCDAVFLPSVEEVYGDGFETSVETGVGRADRNAASEGAYRPTFFKGVATVLTKLFSLIRPDRTYFGEKDAQQVAVVRRLVKDLWMGCEVRVCRTVREEDGLAMSSRNRYLSPEERRVAGGLWRGLQAGKKVADERKDDENGVAADVITTEVRSVVEAEWKDSRGKAIGRVMYVSVCDGGDLRAVSRVVRNAGGVLLCVAATLGHARLIDNIAL